MPRFKNVNGVDIQLTPEEETARDAEEAAVEKAKPAQYWAALRKQRNALLASSDWTQFTDSPLTNEAKTGWATYRQELRDLPTMTQDPVNPTWPKMPV